MRPIINRRSRPSHQGDATGKSVGTGWFYFRLLPLLLANDKRGRLEAMEESRTSIQVLQALNATFLTLIPKEERVSQPKQFRPIALAM
jgi:hypothetical protein